MIKQKKVMSKNTKKLDRINARVEKLMDEIKSLEIEAEEELEDFAEYKKFTERYQDKRKALGALNNVYEALEEVTFRIEEARDL